MDWKNCKLLKPDIEDNLSDLDVDSDFNGDHDAGVKLQKWKTANKHITKTHIPLPTGEAINAFIASFISHKKQIYTERAQIRINNDENNSLNHGDILVLVDYAELDKKYSIDRNKECVLWKIIVHLVSILTACGYTKSLEEDKDGFKKLSRHFESKYQSQQERSNDFSQKNFCKNFKMYV